jgi:hypothetical protein
MNTAHRTIYLLSFHIGGLTLATLVLTCLSIAGTAKYTRCIAIYFNQQSQHYWHGEHVGMYYGIMWYQRSAVGSVNR